MKEKLHKCEKCGHNFTFAWNLKQHLKHSKYCGTSEEEFKCTNCGKKFTLGSTLKHHFARCIAVDPHRFACQHCPRMFTFKSSLRKHLRGRCPNLSYGSTKKVDNFEIQSFKGIEVVHIDEIDVIDFNRKILNDYKEDETKNLPQDTEEIKYTACGLQDDNVDETYVCTNILDDSVHFKEESDIGLKFMHQDDSGHCLKPVQY